jgi:hypothetical protein
MQRDDLSDVSVEPASNLGKVFSVIPDWNHKFTPWTGRSAYGLDSPEPILQIVEVDFRRVGEHSHGRVRGYDVGNSGQGGSAHRRCPRCRRRVGTELNQKCAITEWLEGEHGRHAEDLVISPR